MKKEQAGPSSSGRGYLDIQTYGQRTGRSIFNLSQNCENVSQMILQQIVQVDKTVDNMTVNLGDEIVYNLYPELSDSVVVINWQQNEWYS